MRRRPAHPGQGLLPLAAELWPWCRLVETFEETYLVGKARNTRRSYGTTFRAVLEEFGPNALPQKGLLYAWLAGKVKRRELMATSANTMRGHLAQLFRTIRDDYGASEVLNAASFPPFPVSESKPEALKDPAGTWPKLRAAMPDARAVLYLALQVFLGLRRSEVLGLEWRHVRWDGKEGPELLIEQQRDAGRAVPEPHLKHKAPRTRYPLVHPEVVKLLREVGRLLMKGAPLYGCRRGALLGAMPCEDGEVRSYVFPYRDEHVNELSRLMQAAAPEEFPRGIRGVRAHKAYHRLRHTFGTEVVKAFGHTEDGRQVAQKLLRHKDERTTVRYTKAVVGQGQSREALRAVAEAWSAKVQQREQEQQRAISSARKPNSPKRSQRQ